MFGFLTHFFRMFGTKWEHWGTQVKLNSTQFL